MSAATVESPIPASAGLDAYGYAAQRTANRQRAARLAQLAAVDDTFLTITGHTLATLRLEADLQERLFWGRIRTLCLAVAVGPDASLTSTIGDDAAPVIAALVEELTLYRAELDAQPYRRDIALAALDQAWLNDRRAYLTDVA